MKRIYQVLLPCLFLVFVIPRIGAQDPVANYPFSGNANDVSTNHNNASIHGATLTQDRFGQANRAFLFDGVQGHLEAKNIPQLQGATTTVMFWVRADEIPAQGEVYLLSFGGWQERWKVSLPSHGKPVWTTHATTCCSNLDPGDANALVIGTWTHLSMVHDGVKDKIYVNGVFAGENDSPGDLGNTSYPLGIGYDPIDAAYLFKGALDEIQIYDTALTEPEIAQKYHDQAQPPSPVNGKVADYMLNGNFRDASEFGNHAFGEDVEFTTDRFGFGKKAANFNGTTSEVEADNSSQLNSPWTSVSFWVNVGSLPASGESYLASFGGWQERWKISLPSHGKLVWTTNHDGGITNMDAGDGNELVPGIWTHVVCVHNTTQDVIFINGVQVAAKDVGGALNNSTYPLGIGYDPIDVANYFNGSLDEVEIFNTPLSAQDVADLYAEQSVAVIDPNPLVLNMPFCGDTKDMSQFGNDGESYDAEFTADRFGNANNAVYIDNEKGAYVEVDNSVQYNSDNTTVSFWVKMNELPLSGEVYLLSFGGWQERWKVSLPSHGKVVWTTYATSCCSNIDAGDGNELVPGTWAHVVASHGPVQDKIYINGVLANAANVGGPLHHTAHELGIGWDPIDKGSVMDGDIDEVRIYNRDLTDQEVADLYAEQSAPPTPPGNNVVGDYPFDGNAKDVSQYCNNGKIDGAHSRMDRFGRANHSFDFNGSAAVTAPNSPQLNSALASVSVWVNVNSLPGSGETYLLSFGGWQERWKISLPSHGKVVWTTFATSCCTNVDAGDGNELVPGAWTHLVFVHDGLKDIIYVNGVLANQTDAIGDLHSTVHPLGIGYDPIDVANYFDGSLDDILIYNSALTAPEVAALYALQSADPGETDSTAPEAPVGIKGEVNFTDVALSWQPSVDDESGIAGYNVYQDGDIIQTVEETELAITGLEPLTDYEFGVSAVDSAGNESATSFLVVTTGMDATPDTVKPSTPTNLVVSAGATSAVFSWDASTDEGGVAYYIVYLDGDLVDTIPPEQTSIFIGGLEPSTLYTFEVEAVDLSGNISERADITVSTTEPIVTAEPGLVAHYKLEGDANDATPYNNHGTIGGNPIFETVTGHPGSNMALAFDGVGDSILVPNAVQLISDYATVSFWVRVDGINLDDPEAYIIDFGNYDERWKISLPHHLKIVWTTNGNNAQFDHLFSDMDSGDGNELVIGFWWYVTMVHDGTDDIIYLDGVEVNRKPINTLLNSTGRSLAMGNNLEFTGHEYFHGALDEVKIYNKALTDDEILQLFTLGYTSVQDLQNELHKYVEVIYPNPAKDQLIIKHGFDSGKDLLIRIFDPLGRQVDAIHVVSGQMESGMIPINVAKLHTGSYSLNFVLSGKNMGSIPFVKQ